MIRSAATLARWLGPWADGTKLPDVATRDDAIGGGSIGARAGGTIAEMRVRIYEPRRAPRATYLIAPGLHYAGADDPRLDRFCRVLAAAGHLVVAPFVPDYLALTPNEGAKRDFVRAFRALPRWSTQRPVVFSISFGSLLAFALAAEHGDELDGLVIFGGYCDFHETMRFCLAGEVGSTSAPPSAVLRARQSSGLRSGRTARRDPLNQPVVFSNLLHCIEPPAADPAALLAGWRRYVERTWGRPELKVDNRFVAIAEELAPSVPASVRELFLIGIGARPGSLPIATAALARFDATALDPSPDLARITNRVDLLHGMDDDVIPFEQSHALAAKLVRAKVRTHITGLYDHTGSSRPSLRDAVREAKTMVGMLRVLAR